MAEGASPAAAKAFRQYSGSEVYWSQAMQAQVSGFTPGAGSRIWAGRIPILSKAMVFFLSVQYVYLKTV